MTIRRKDVGEQSGFGQSAVTYHNLCVWFVCATLCTGAMKILCAESATSVLVFLEYAPCDDVGLSSSCEPARFVFCELQTASNGIMST